MKGYIVRMVKGTARHKTTIQLVKPMAAIAEGNVVFYSRGGYGGTGQAVT